MVGRSRRSDLLLATGRDQSPAHRHDPPRASPSGAGRGTGYRKRLVFIDGRQICSGSTLETDVCIIGGGPAGIVIARELSETRTPVVLVESGGWRPNKLAQSLNAAELAPGSRHPPPEMYRERRFGGSSTIWGGRCVPLAP